MLKYFITGLIIYFVYQTFFKRPSLKAGQDNHRVDASDKVPPAPSKKNNEDEYIDYEEVE